MKLVPLALDVIITEQLRELSRTFYAEMICIYIHGSKHGHALSYQPQTLAKDIKEMSEEMDKNKNLFSQAFPENGDNRDVIEDTLGCLLGRLSLLDSVVNQRCHQMKERLQQILNFQVRYHQETFDHHPAIFSHKQGPLRRDIDPLFFFFFKCTESKNITEKPRELNSRKRKLNVLCS